ncbi:nuclear transport factor 2 family protein [Streptomyces sp. NPDC057555]|uniref:nuclear transport factor 2 family protein n=1 Tax=Streptomyces sp. NPDC057555 TaxID=3346166 RepID=UPI0036BDFD37
MTTTTRTAPAHLYAHVQDFYARHMHLVDEGRVEEWGETFTPDATISNNANPRPAHGRDAIVAVIRRTHAELAARGIQHRHWMGMLAVEPLDDHTVRATSYALLLATTPGATPQIDRSTRCEDELVLVNGDWQIRTRRVHHDGLA